MNERMVPTYLRVPFCCFVLCCLVGILPFSVLTHFPHFPLLIFNATYVSFVWWSFNFPLFLLPHFPQFPLLVFNVFFFLATFPAHTFSPFSHFGVQSLFYFCTAMFLIVQGGSPMIFQLCPPFLFFHLGGRGAHLI